LSVTRELHIHGAGLDVWWRENLQPVIVWYWMQAILDWLVCSESNNDQNITKILGFKIKFWHVGHLLQSRSIALWHHCDFVNTVISFSFMKRTLYNIMLNWSSFSMCHWIRSFYHYRRQMFPFIKFLNFLTALFIPVVKCSA